MEQPTTITIEALQQLVHQIVASTLTGVILARMDTSKAADPHHDAAHDDQTPQLLAQATKEVMQLYTTLWEALEAILPPARPAPADTETDTSISG